MKHAKSTRRGGLFVTGTDTGVGKTVVAAGLVTAWRRAGLDAVGFKPVETGVAGLAPGQTWPAPGGMPADGIWLAAASGWVEPLPEVVPLGFAPPLAPAVAAQQAGRQIDLTELVEAYARLASRHDFVVAEGAGGLAVPLAPGVSMADLARQLGLALVIVCRAGLGTLNHTVLTVRYAQSQGLAPRGLIINGMPAADDVQAHAADPALASNAEQLAALTGVPILGTLPPAPRSLATPADAAQWLTTHNDVTAWSALAAAR